MLSPFSSDGRLLHTVEDNELNYVKKSMKYMYVTQPGNTLSTAIVSTAETKGNGYVQAHLHCNQMLTLILTLTIILHLTLNPNPNH